MYILSVIHKFISVEIIEIFMFVLQDFYSVLGVSKNANKSEIKSGEYASDQFYVIGIHFSTCQFHLRCQSMVPISI